jgi:polyribonucleotide nucleotidyltransferase
MFNVTTKSIQWGEETLTLETGKVARQADGSVIATLGETSVMANVTFAKEAKGAGLLPADGPLPGKILRRGQGARRLLQARGAADREGDADRAAHRPADPPAVREGFKNEVLVMCTVLSHDLVNDPDIVAMIAASAALTISGAPFMGPIAGAGWASSTANTC